MHGVDSRDKIHVHVKVVSGEDIKERFSTLFCTFGPGCVLTWTSLSVNRACTEMVHVFYFA